MRPSIQVADQPQVPGEVVRVGDAPQSEGQDLGFGPAEHPAQGVVHLQVLALRADQRHPVGRVGEGAFQAGLALPQGLLGLDQRGRVQGDAVPEGAAVHLAARHRPVLQPAQALGGMLVAPAQVVGGQVAGRGQAGRHHAVAVLGGAAVQDHAEVGGHRGRVHAVQVPGGGAEVGHGHAAVRPQPEGVDQPRGAGGDRFELLGPAFRGKPGLLEGGQLPGEVGQPLHGSDVAVVVGGRLVADAQHGPHPAVAQHGHHQFAQDHGVPLGQPPPALGAGVVVVDHRPLFADGVGPDAGLAHRIVGALALGAAELGLGAGAPGLQVQGLSVLEDEMVEADAAAGEDLKFIQGGAQHGLEAQLLGPLHQPAVGLHHRRPADPGPDVLEGDGHQAVLHRGGGDAEPGPAAVGVGHAHLHIADHEAFLERAHRGEFPGGHRGSVEPDDVPLRAGDVPFPLRLGGQPEQLLGHGVGAQDAALPVGQDDAQREFFEQGLQQVRVGLDGAGGAHGDPQSQEAVPEAVPVRGAG